MSQKVEVQGAGSADRGLIFSGAAAIQANVVGNFMPERVILHDHFIADYSEQDWVAEATNGSTIAQAVANGGTVTIVTGGSVDDCGEFSHAVQWSGAKNCVMEARINVSNITSVGINVGWIDADLSTNDQIGFELTGTALVNARANEGAVFVFDTDGDTDVWYVAATDSGNEGTPVVLQPSVAPVNSTYENLRVTIDTDGNARFYRNGKTVGFLGTAITAAGLLTPYVAIIDRAGSARTLTIDRITCWQDE